MIMYRCIADFVAIEKRVSAGEATRRVFAPESDVIGRRALLGLEVQI
jgi:hypothetical protein